MSILLAVHILVTAFLIMIILIQKNDGGSSLFASGGSGSMLSARGASNLLTKATWTLSSIFLVNCVIMAAVASRDIKEAQTIIEKKANENRATANTSEDSDESSGEAGESEPARHAEEAQDGDDKGAEVASESSGDESKEEVAQKNKDAKDE
jgi:preprotein translocase subunit SecG